MSGIATLPVGYRPLKRKIFSVPCLAQTSCRLDVFPDGNIVVYGGTGTGFLGLDGGSFPID